MFIRCYNYQKAINENKLKNTKLLKQSSVSSCIKSTTPIRSTLEIQKNLEIDWSATKLHSLIMKNKTYFTVFVFSKHVLSFFLF